MNTYHIPQTNSTPSIFFDRKSELLKIEGRSLSSDPDSFYQPLEDLINRHLEQQNSLQCTISLEYFNSSSVRCLLGLFKVMEQHALKGKHVSIRWLYDFNDEDSRDFAHDMQSLLKIPIAAIPVSN